MDLNPFTFGNYYRFSLFGGSHEPLIGVEIEGIPAGTPLNQEALQAFLDRRAPGRSPFTSLRQEEDIPLFVKGLEGGIFTGERVRAVIRNRDIRPEDYEALRTVPRPGHADYPAYVKTGRIPAGGGHFSGRLTAAYGLAGGIALQILAREDIQIAARIHSLGGIPGDDEEAVTAKLQAIKEQGDSLGGIIECTVTGLPIGLGDHPFMGLENRLAAALFAIPALKGLEFGDGFALARMQGSQANDGYRLENGTVTFKSNHCGGVLGGMACGTPLVFRAAFKPTPSISLPQPSVDLERKENVTLSISGRHDPCLVLRAVPVVEGAAAAALLDALWEDRARNGGDLTAFRQTIDAADRQLLEAFTARMKAVKQIGAYKKEKGLPILDEAREQTLLSRIREQTPPDLAQSAEELFESILKLSKDYQQ